MKSIIKISLGLIVLRLYSPCVFSQSIEMEFEELLDSTYLKNKGAVGILLHIESAKSNISWSQAAGYANKLKSEPLRKDQAALIASNTKPMWQLLF